MRQIALAFALALAPAAALAASLGVPLDQSTLITLSGPAHNVIIGNPSIADVAVQDQRHIIITGKGAGVTNLLVTNDAGRPIFNRQIIVGGGSTDRVLLISGGNVQKYACAAFCVEESGAQGPAATAGAIPSSPAFSVAAPNPQQGSYNHPAGVSASPNLP
jgi:hypothetical protein